jgi:hypothetical protein
MSKKNPAYETGWHTTGTLKVLPSVDQVAERLESNPAVALHALNLSSQDGWWSYDAVWTTEDGARVRGRLNLHNQKPGSEKDPEKAALNPRTYDPSVRPMEGYFHAFADADKPWDPAWPSPLNMFLERKLKPSYVTMAYGGHNALHLKSTGNLSGLLSTLAELPWIATVLTHDELDPRVFMPESGVAYETPLISRLPSSLYGRVLDVRIMGDLTREKVNRTLAKYGTYLPEGGVAILLDHGRRKGIPRAELSFKLDRPFIRGGDITPVAASLSKMLREQIMVSDTEAVEEIRKDWFLLTPEEQAQQDTVLLRDAGIRVGELENEVTRLKEALEASQEFTRKFRESGDNLLEEARKAFAEKDQAIEERNKLRGELDRLLRMIRDSDLGKAIAAREEAENEAEAAEELLDEQNHEVAGLRQENARLRSELARLGSTFASVSGPEKKTAPSTWDDFFAQVPSLEYVVLGDVESEVDKLRRQVQEGNWLNRSWEALLALEEYARLKKERGASELPHFRAYLLDPQAEHIIPRTRYSSTESKGVMMNGRFVAARTFPVPHQVDPSGKIVMEAHIRIGSGKPPAPRLHFHDDTSGNTGKIYVGHIGPHLPNYQTN